MARFRAKAPEPAPEPKRRALTAAAAVLTDRQTGMSAYRARSNEDAWQRTAWAYYDSIGELNASVKWVANAVSLADMYAAEVDEETGLVSEATDNATVQAVVNSILGGPVKRSQAQATMVVNWLIAGEFFIVVRSDPRGDQWYVLSATEVTERGGEFKYCDPITGAMIPVRPRDLLIRIWNPHPRYQTHADSSVRSAAPILAEIERTTMNIAARLDSRLAGAGVMWVPEEADFPITDADAEEDEQSLLGLLKRAAETSLSNPGQASSQVPILVPMRSDLIPNIVHQSFTTELSQEVIDLRDNAVRRLAMSMDIPPEVMTGMGESSHWNAWQIEEATYKIHVAPLLDRIGDALTSTYLQPQLQRMGVANADQFVLAFSTNEIISRPNRFEELNSLFDKGLISEDFLRTELGIPDDAVPTQDEMHRMLLQKLLLQDTSLLAIPQAAELVGIDVAAVPADTNPSQPGIQSEAPVAAIEGPPTQGDEEADNGLVAAAELMVFDALSRAGGRLLTREHRGQYGHVAKHELYQVIDGASQADSLLEGSFQFAAPTAQTLGADATKLERNLRGYCRMKIVMQEPHDREELRRWLTM